MENTKPFLFVIFFGITLSSCAQEFKNEKFENEKIILEKVLESDQKYRTNHLQTNIGKRDSVDRRNLEVVSKIIDSLGWLSKEEVGERANAAIFLVIQHSNLFTMEKYLPVMRKAVAENKASKQALALLIDRVEMLNYRKQIYGSQLINKEGKYILYDVIEPSKINERRKEMGLENIEDYLKGFTK
jgi:lipopolysaccharide biosynthesis regulator YciM